MTFIRPATSYANSIIGGRHSSTAKNAPESSKEVIAGTNPQTKHVSANDVFNYMNASYAQVKPTTSQVNLKGITSDCKTRIKNSVNQFESMFHVTLDVIKDEFGDILSDDAMKTLTLQLLT